MRLLPMLYTGGDLLLISLLLPAVVAAVAMVVPANRTMTYWASASDPVVNGRPSCYTPPCANWSLGSQDWEDRLALLAKHRENVTGLIPCIHAVVDGGTLGSNTEGSYKNFLPYLPKLKSMGFEITAFLGNAGRTGGGRPALEAMIKRGPAFIQDCVAMAKKNGYDGYSVDHELHCNEDAGHNHPLMSRPSLPRQVLLYM
jgi:hypothetical protein